MTDLDRQSRLYAADRLLGTVDGIFRAQHIKQAYMDGYNAAIEAINTDKQPSITSINPITSTL